MGLSYNPSSVSDGIVLYLDAANPRSYAGTGTTWYDISGNSNDAGFVNSPTYLSVPQPYFNFNGTNDYMKIVRSASMSPTTGLTQEVWFNYPSVPTTAIFIGLQYGSSSGNSYALWKESATTINGGVNTSGTFSFIGMGTTNLVGNRWYHFVHTYDGSTQKLYLNGTLMTTGSQSGTIQYDVNNTRVLIGADDNGAGYNTGAVYFHSGKLSQVRIYNRGLSATEVLRNYNAQRKRYFQEENIVTDGLVLNLDPANSNSYAGTGTSIYDLSGLTNTGTLVNGPTFSGSNGGIIAFDGTNDSIDLGDKFDMGLSSFTFCTYFKLSATTFLHGIFSKSIAADATQRYAVFIYNYGGGFKISTFMSNGGGSDVETPSAITVTTNTWYHISVVYNRADKVYLYVNGVLDSSATISQFQAVNFQSNYNFRIGSYGDASNNPNYFLNGYLSQFQIYNRILTQQEILQNYTATKGRFGL